MENLVRSLRRNIEVSAWFLALCALQAVVAAQQPQAALNSAPLTIDQTPQTATKPKPKPPAKPAPPRQLKRTGLERTRIDASMVGYLDPSVVATQVRVRFDAGFNAPRPDRAEYFYQGTNSPGPGTTDVQTTLNFQELYLYGEYAPAFPRLQRVSAFVQLPFRWIQPFFVPGTVPPGTTTSPSTGGGISDLNAGLKFAAIASASRNLTFAFGADFPTGNGPNGLGTGHYTIEPKALFSQRLSDRAAIEAEFGDSHPIGGTLYYATPQSQPQNFSADVAMYGVGPSYALIQRDRYRIAPVLELVSWHVFSGLQTGSNNTVQSAAGINVFNAKLGARASFADGSSIYAGYGRGITSDIWYRNLFRIEYRRIF